MAKKEKIVLDIEIEGLDKMNSSLEETVDTSKTLREQFIQAKKELDKLAGADIIDQEAMDEAIQKMSEMKDRMSDVNEQVSVFASGSKYEQVGNAFGQIGSAVRSLDFGKAQERAQAFATAAGKISFKDAIQSVKQLGSTFATLGKALMTNPLFLVTAIVVAIVAAIVMLMDKLGLLQMYLDLIGKAFDFLIQKIKDFLDWIGLTSFAEEESAERSKIASEKRASASARANKQIEGDREREIALMRAEGASIEDIEDKEIELARLRLSNFKAANDQAIANLQWLKRIGKATEEQLDQLAEAESKMSAFETDISIVEANVASARKERAEKETQDQKAEGAKRAADRKKRQEEADKKEKESAELRLKIARETEDLKIALMDAGIEKELEINRVKFERLKADILANEKLTNEEKNNLIELNRQQREVADDALFEAETKKEWDRQELRLNALRDAKILNMEEGLEKEKAVIQLASDDEIAQLRKLLEDKIITYAEFEDLELEAIRRKNEQIEALEKESNEKRAAEDKILQDQKVEGVKNGLSAMSSLVDLFTGQSEASAKRAFKAQKAVQIATTTIDTYKSATAAFSSLAGIPIVGPVLGGLAAGAAVAAGLANIKKIASTKFGETGGGGSPASPARVSTANANTAMAVNVPGSLSFFGNANTGGTTTDNDGPGNRQQVIKAVVVESDITSTQERLGRYRNLSEIG